MKDNKPFSMNIVNNYYPSFSFHIYSLYIVCFLYINWIFFILYSLYNAIFFKCDRWFRSLVAITWPCLISNPLMMQDIQNHFVNYMVNDSLGVIVNSHMAFSDQEKEKARNSKCLRLAELHSIAVDFDKTGVLVQVTLDLFPRK